MGLLDLAPEHFCGVKTVFAMEKPQTMISRTLACFIAVTTLAYSAGPSSQWPPRRGVQRASESAGILTPQRLMRGHRGQVTALTYSHDGRCLASVSDDGAVKVWDAASGRCLGTLRRRARRALFLPGRYALLVGASVWNFHSRQAPRAVIRSQPSVDPLALSPDGKLLVAGIGGALQIWRTNGWRLVRTVHVPRAADEAGRAIFIESARFSTHGSALAVVTTSINDGEPPVPIARVTLWDTRTWTVRRALEDGGFDTGAAAAFSPDGRRLAIGTDGMGSTGEVLVWDLGVGMKRVLVPEGEGNDDMAWVNQGRWLVTGGDPSTVFLRDAESGRKVAQLPHPSRVRSFAAAPDGRTLATGDWDGAIRLWAVPSAHAPAPIRSRSVTGGVRQRAEP